MKHLLSFLLLVLSTGLLANPILPNTISEIFLDETGCQLELARQYDNQGGEFWVQNAVGDSICIGQLDWQESGQFFVAVTTVQASQLSFNRSADSVILKFYNPDTDCYYLVDSISWGTDNTQAPEVGQSLARCSPFFSDYPICIEPVPSIGYNPYQVSSTSTIQGCVTDRNNSAVIGADVYTSFGVTQTDGLGYYDISVPSCLVQVAVYIGDAYMDDAQTLTHPYQTATLNVHLDNYPAGIHEQVPVSPFLQVSNPTRIGRNLEFNLENGQDQSLRITLYNTRGQRVQVFSGHTTNNHISMPCKSNLGAGVYLYKAQGANHNWSGKITLIK